MSEVALSRARILVVDDRPGNLMSIVELLRTQDWIIMTAGSGTEALRILMDHDFSVILLDVNMPGMDGFEVARMIRARPRSASTPIIFVTAFRMEDTAVNTGYELGAVDYIFTPIVPVILRAKIAVFVDLDMKARHLKVLLAEREANEARYRLLFHGSPIPLWELDLSTTKQHIEQLRQQFGNDLAAHLMTKPELLAAGLANIDLREVNSATLEMFGAQDETALRRDLPRVFANASLTTLRDQFLLLDRGASTTEGETTLLTFAGKTKHVGFRVSILPGHEHNWSRVVVSTSDIAELQRQRFELERSNRELQQFAYVASHDLRAPLRAIDALSGWLAEDLGAALAEEQREQMALLRGRVRRMDRLLADLLEYAKAGGDDGRVEQVSVAELVREATELSNCPPGFVVELTVPDQPFETAAVPLRRVLLNLITNAIKHHDQREGRVEVSFIDEGQRWSFTVADDGPGIPSQFHERVFRMFQTLQPRDTVEGSGMGLALVKKLVESAGGRIAIAPTEAARGASFIFSWPKQWSERQRL